MPALVFLPDDYHLVIGEVSAKSWVSNDRIAIGFRNRVRVLDLLKLYAHVYKPSKMLLAICSVDSPVAAFARWLAIADSSLFAASSSSM